MEQSITIKGYGDPNITRAAFYFTVVFDGTGTVSAMFFNSKEMESFHWITALMTSYSRQINSSNLQEVITDMKEIFTPHGKYHAEGYGEVNSIVHHLGLILEKVDQTVRDGLPCPA